jgi:hypothetical protein
MLLCLGGSQADLCFCVCPTSAMPGIKTFCIRNFCLTHLSRDHTAQRRLVSSDVSMPRSCPGQIAERVSPLRPP